jgi:hypothetical protein
MAMKANRVTNREMKTLDKPHTRGWMPQGLFPVIRRKRSVLR